MDNNLFSLSLIVTGAVIIAMAIFGCGVMFYFKRFLLSLYNRICTEKHWDNPIQLFHIIKRVSPARIVETKINAATGVPKEKPFGKRDVISPWNNLFFNPVYFHRLPLLNYENIGTNVVIGPGCRQPLRIEAPILIGGMAYGVLSAKTKQALAMGATMAGTASNTGNGPFLYEERCAAEKLIIQFSRGYWVKDLEVLKEADAVEIQLGKGIWRQSSATIPHRRLARSAEIRALAGPNPGEKAIISSRLIEMKSSEELGKLIESLRQKTGGVPIGVKIGGTQWLEKELEMIVKATPDFISIEGLESGTSGELGPGLDFLGIPTLYAINRACKFLKNRKLNGKISLLAGGGLNSAMDFLKALALGADAVFIGSMSLIAMLNPEVTKVFPWSSPTSLLFNSSKKSSKLNVTLAGQCLANYLKSSVQEMQIAALAMGKNHLSDVDRSDMSTVNNELGKLLGISWVGEESYYKDQSWEKTV